MAACLLCLVITEPFGRGWCLEYVMRRTCESPSARALLNLTLLDCENNFVSPADILANRMDRVTRQWWVVEWEVYKNFKILKVIYLALSNDGQVLACVRSHVAAERRGITNLTGKSLEISLVNKIGHFPAVCIGIKA